MIEVLARQLQQIKQTDLIVNIFSFSRFDYYKSVKLVENNILSDLISDRRSIGDAWSICLR